MKKRLDEVLVERGLAMSRSRARDAILRGLVTVDGVVAAKAGAGVGAHSRIEVGAGAGTDFVSRGALKLLAALESFGFDATARVAVDAGASTGGFSEVLVQSGAHKVYAVDVGHGQLHERLRACPRIVSREGQDIRMLGVKDFAEPVTALTVDLSFISLAKVLPGLMALGAPGCWMVALIKPQFEVGREGIGKGGLVKDEALRHDAVTALYNLVAAQAGWRVTGLIASPIEGGSGNVEYLMGALRDG